MQFCYVFFFFFSSNMCEVNIATINVNGLRVMEKRAEVFEVVKQKKN